MSRVLFVAYGVGSCLFLFSFICGLIVTIAIAVVKGKFLDSCLLYSSFSSNGKVDFGSVHNCNFLIGGTSVFGVVIPFLLLLFFGFLIYRGNYELEGSFIFLIITVLTICCFLLNLISACIISVGKSIMCDNYLSTIKGAISCNQIDEHIWYKGSSSFEPKSSIYTLTVAEVTAWVNLIWWGSLSALNIWRFIRQRRQSA